MKGIPKADEEMEIKSNCYGGKYEKFASQWTKTATMPALKKT